MGARVSPSPVVTGCGSFLRNRAAFATGTAGGAPPGPWPALAPAHAWPLRRESRRPWPPPVRLAQPAQISAASLGNYRPPAAGAGRAQGPRPRDSQPPKESGKVYCGRQRARFHKARALGRDGTGRGGAAGRRGGDVTSSPGALGRA